MRVVRGILVVSMVLGLASVAAAQSFDELADGAVKVSGDKGLAALFWSQTSNCSKISNDVYRRQCEGVRKARRQHVTKGTYLVETAASISAGDYDAKKKSVPISGHACVSCSGEMKVDGKTRYVVGQGRVSVKGDEVHAATLFSTAKTFKRPEAAAVWKKTVLPRLRSQFLVRLPDRLDKWNKGYKVEVLGHRIYDPCNGKVMHAKPESRLARQDSRLCPESEQPAEKPKQPDKEVVEKPKGPQLPARLSTAQISSVLAPVRKAGPTCYDTYGVQGTAKVKITFSGDGELTALALVGEFKDTPTGTCILKAAEGLTFPKSHKKSTTVTYPVNVR